MTQKQYLFIFDMGGVVSEHCYVWNQICHAMGFADDGDVCQSFRRLEQAVLRGDITSMEMLALVARRTHVPPPQENYWASFFQPVLNSNTVALINELRTAGNRVVCGSNTIDAHFAYHAAHEQYACFDAVYASHLIGQAKPDITFWHYIKQAEQHYAFADMLFFDDMAENVAAAASLGIHAHQFTTADDARRYIESVVGADVFVANDDVCNSDTAHTVNDDVCNDESAPDDDSACLAAVVALLQPTVTTATAASGCGAQSSVESGPR